MTDFRFRCPHCRQSLEAPPELLGMAVDCPACNGCIQLPEHPPTPDPEPAPKTESAPKPEPMTKPEPAPLPPPPDPRWSLHHLKRLKTRYQRRLVSGIILTCLGGGMGIGMIGMFFRNPVPGYTARQQQSAAVFGFCGGVLLLAGGIALLRAAKTTSRLMLVEKERMAKEGPPLPW